MNYRKTFTKDQAYQKLKHYCGYQERCHLEVKEKAYSFGLRKNEVEELTSKLIEEDYLNEERFAVAFARGKFKMKQWGKVKIAYELKQKRVSGYCLNKALKEIDDDAYLKAVERMAADKWRSVKGVGVNKFVKLAKTRDYLLQKGFESSLINAQLQQLQSESSQDN